MPRVKFLTVVEIKYDVPKGRDVSHDNVFNNFQESVEGCGLADTVAQASLADLEEFAPDVVTLQPGRIDLPLPGIAVDEAEEEDEDDDAE